MAMGWIMGLYQMLKGAHYLSHTVTTMLLAWIIICLIHQAVTGLEGNKHMVWVGYSPENARQQLPNRFHI
jgi:membrane-associated PAP2 superfamily phosphatase